jgi:hypothetical protein
MTHDNGPNPPPAQPCRHVHRNSSGWAGRGEVGALIAALLPAPLLPARMHRIWKLKRVLGSQFVP